MATTKTTISTCEPALHRHPSVDTPSMPVSCINSSTCAASPVSMTRQRCVRSSVLFRDPTETKLRASSPSFASFSSSLPPTKQTLHLPTANLLSPLFSPTLPSAPRPHHGTRAPIKRDASTASGKGSAPGGPLPSSMSIRRSRRRIEGCAEQWTRRTSASGRKEGETTMIRSGCVPVT